jgi:hypothetical protein
MKASSNQTLCSIFQDMFWHFKIWIQWHRHNTHKSFRQVLFRIDEVHFNLGLLSEVRHRMVLNHPNLSSKLTLKQSSSPISQPDVSTRNYTYNSSTHSSSSCKSPLKQFKNVS